MATTPPAPQQPSTYSWGLLIVFSLFGLVCLGGVLFLIYTGALKTEDAARNVITIVFTVGTISLAIILVLAVLLQDDPTAIERFQRGKEVLTILVGILGTIIGFYFGSKTVETQAAKDKSAAESQDITAPPATGTTPALSNEAK